MNNETNTYLIFSLVPEMLRLTAHSSHIYKLLDTFTITSKRNYIQLIFNCYLIFHLWYLLLLLIKQTSCL